MKCLITVKTCESSQCWRNKSACVYACVRRHRWWWLHHTDFRPPQQDYASIPSCRLHVIINHPARHRNNSLPSITRQWCHRHHAPSHSSPATGRPVAWWAHRQPADLNHLLVPPLRLHHVHNNNNNNTSHRPSGRRWLSSGPQPISIEQLSRRPRPPSLDWRHAHRTLPHQRHQPVLIRRETPRPSLMKINKTWCVCLCTGWAKKASLELCPYFR